MSNSLRGLAEIFFVAKPTLCETEVRASQSEPICLSGARGRRVACLKVLWEAAREQPPISRAAFTFVPDQLDGNALLVEVQPLTPRKSCCGKFQHIDTRDSIFIMWVQFSSYGVPFSSHASTHIPFCGFTHNVRMAGL